MWTKRTVKTEESRQDCSVLLIKTHRRLNSIAVLAVHAETSQLYSLQYLYIRATELYNQ